MRDNLQTAPVNPSRPDEGDLYDNIEIRPNTTEAQKETGRNAYIELLESQARWAGGTILGCHFPEDFKEQGGTALLNQQIKSAHELAVMAQILRDPRFETRGYFIREETASFITQPLAPDCPDRCIWNRSTVAIIMWEIG